jgi:hypothetical protein
MCTKFWLLNLKRRSNLYKYMRCILTCISLLGNDSVNTFPPEPTRTTIERLLLGNGSVNTPKKYGAIEDGIFREVYPEAL